MSKARGCISDETRRKMSEAKKGRRLSDEHCRKLSAAKKGHLTSNETRKKLSIALTGRHLSDSHRRKISLVVKKQWHSIPKWKRQQITALQIRRMLKRAGRPPSSLECILHQQLNKAGVVFETQKEFSPYFVDIWIPKLNLAVECDGTYWHNLLGRQNQDRKRDCYLITRYKICVVRIPGKIIRSNPEQVVSEIMRVA
jgi:very-short-patch-repair endonuclease